MPKKGSNQKQGKTGQGHGRPPTHSAMQQEEEEERVAEEQEPDNEEEEPVMDGTDPDPGNDSDSELK